MKRTPNAYIVGYAMKRNRIFQVREGKRLGIKCKTYWTLRGHNQKWTKYTGIIYRKSRVVYGRAAAREILRQKNAGTYC